MVFRCVVNFRARGVGIRQLADVKAFGRGGAPIQDMDLVSLDVSVPYVPSAVVRHEVYPPESDRGLRIPEPRQPLSAHPVQHLVSPSIGAPPDGRALIASFSRFRVAFAIPNRRCSALSSCSYSMARSLMTVDLRASRGVLVGSTRFAAGSAPSAVAARRPDDPFPTRNRPPSCGVYGRRIGGYADNSSRIGR